MRRKRTVPNPAKENVVSARPSSDRSGRDAPSLMVERVASLCRGAQGTALPGAMDERRDGVRTEPGPTRMPAVNPSKVIRRPNARRSSRQPPHLVRSHPPLSHAPVRGARWDTRPRAVVPRTFTDRAGAVAERSDRMEGRSDHSGTVVRRFGLAYPLGSYQGWNDRGARHRGGWRSMGGREL